MTTPAPARKVSFKRDRWTIHIDGDPKWANRLFYFGYSMGIFSGGCFSQQGGARYHEAYLKGKRVYILGWPREFWRCLPRGHWPHPVEMLGFGRCGRCTPWPCCNAHTESHRVGCLEA